MVRHERKRQTWEGFAFSDRSRTNGPEFPPQKSSASFGEYEQRHPPWKRSAQPNSQIFEGETIVSSKPDVDGGGRRTRLHLYSRNA